MAPMLKTGCPRCGHATTPKQKLCALCGQILAVRPGKGPVHVSLGGAPAAKVAPAKRKAPNAFYVRAKLVERTPGRVGAVVLALGLAVAAGVAIVPFVRLMGWVLGALVHEMGHSLTAWLFGIPAVPTLSPGGHALSLEGERILPLSIALWGGAVFAAWRLVPGPRRRYVAAGMALAGYGLCAFGTTSVALRLVGGHVGELVFAGICLARAVSGGFTETRSERLLYAVVGWYLVGANALLTGGLFFSDAKRALYAGNGSYGVTNDYIRLANDVLGLPLEAVAMGMTLAAVAVVPIAFAIGVRLARRDLAA